MSLHVCWPEFCETCKAAKTPVPLTEKAAIEQLEKLILRSPSPIRLHSIRFDGKVQIQLYDQARCRYSLGDTLLEAISNHMELEGN